MKEKELTKSDYEVMIFTIRGKKVMVDYDLSLLYEVPTKALKQQVKRNHSRFPEDFIFELSKSEKNELVTICDRLSFLKHSSVNPSAWGLSNKYEKDYFSLSSAKFFAEFRRVILLYQISAKLSGFICETQRENEILIKSELLKYPKSEQGKIIFHRIFRVKLS